VALCFVSIGSNVERERNIRGALAALHERFGPLLVSAVHETQAVGFTGDPFYNLTVGFCTERSAGDAALALADIEIAHGRARTGERFAPRALDLDLLLYDALVIDENGLELPRPEIDKYAFVLEPLAEIAPDLVHPLSGRSYRELWNEFDKSCGPARKVALSL